MKSKSQPKIKQIILTVCAILLLICIVLTGASLYGKHQMQKIPSLSFAEALAYTTHENEDAIITVGIIKDGSTSYIVYGNNGEVLPDKVHTYEIGSLTKTMTAALISRAMDEGLLTFDSTLNEFLDLTEEAQYPSLLQLLTHTSGYKSYYFESPMFKNFFAGRNDFYGITDDMILARLSRTRTDDKDHSFCYSNFGYAALGLVLESVYDTSYTVLLNTFLQDELGMTSSEISDGSGDLTNYWDWKQEDSYISAGAVTSDINDMLIYLSLQLKEKDYLKRCHESLKTINASSASYEAIGIRMDEIGMAWIIDRKNQIIWHNGGTDDYNCYMGYNLETQTGVVILSNLSPGYRIPATVLGVKLLAEIQAIQ